MAQSLQQRSERRRAAVLTVMAGCRSASHFGRVEPGQLAGDGGDRYRTRLAARSHWRRRRARPDLRRVPLPNEGLYSLRVLAGALAIYGLATVAHGSGFLARSRHACCSRSAGTSRC